MKRKLISILSVIVITLVATGLIGCESSTKKTAKIKNEGHPIVLATMTDEESRIIGSMMEQVLKSNGYEVNSKVGTFNNTTLVRQSLLQKQADLSLDYTGRGMMFIKDVDIANYQKDFETAFQTTKKADEKNGIIWMCYAPYNNTDGICVKKEWAEKNNIKTFEDFAKYVNEGKPMKIAVSSENSYAATEPTCIPGWEKAYGFKLGKDQLVVGVSDPLTMVANNVDGIIACHTYTTAGTLDKLNLYVIKDPKIIAPVYSPAPIATKELVEKYPEISGLLKPIFDSLDADKIKHLNEQLSAEGKNEQDIASAYLKEAGLLK